jgi:drug/metabolite transporter (DMT)-like permease
VVHAVLIVVQAFFATLAIAAKLALRELPPAALIVLRVSGAAATLLALRRISGIPGVRGRGDLARVALYSLFGVVLNQLLYMQGLTLTTAIHANLLITTVPVFTLAAAVLAGHERATKTGVAGLVLAMAGALFLLDPTQLDLSGGTALGDLLILLNALAYALFLVFSKEMLRRYEPLAVISAVFLFGAVGTLPFGVPGLIATDLGEVSTRTWLLVGYIVLVPTVATYWISLWALRRATSSLVAVYIYVQPLVTVAIAPLLLGERPGPRVAGAGAAIFAGIALVAAAQEGQRRRARAAVVGGDLRA